MLASLMGALGKLCDADEAIGMKRAGLGDHVVGHLGPAVDQVRAFPVHHPDGPR